jgi:hypothetical protein
MLANLSNLGKAGLFYLLVMTLSLALVLFFRIAAPQNDMVIPVNMMTPLLATVIMLFLMTGEGYTREGRAPLGLAAPVGGAGDWPCFCHCLF